jgi:hypothetical protein
MPFFDIARNAAFNFAPFARRLGIGLYTQILQRAVHFTAFCVEATLRACLTAGEERPGAARAVRRARKGRPDPADSARAERVGYRRAPRRAASLDAHSRLPECRVALQFLENAAKRLSDQEMTVNHENLHQAQLLGFAVLRPSGIDF